MPRPKYLDIGAKRLSVEFVPFDDMDEKEANGYVRYDDCEIVIRDDLNEQTQANVLLHEAMHVMYRRVEVPGIQLPAKRLSSADFEELVVVMMSDGVCELFRRNQHFAKWWAECLGVKM